MAEGYISKIKSLFDNTSKPRSSTVLTLFISAVMIFIVCLLLIIFKSNEVSIKNQGIITLPIPEGISSFYIDPASLTIAYGSGTNMLSLQSLSPIKTFTSLIMKGKVTHIAFSSNLKYIAAALDTNNVQIYDLEHKYELAVLPHEAPIYRIDFFNSDTSLATFSIDHKLRIWNVDSPQVKGIIPLEDSFINAIDVGSSRNEYAIGTKDGVFKIVNLYNNFTRFEFKFSYSISHVRYDAEKDTAVIVLSNGLAREIDTSVNYRRIDTWVAFDAARSNVIAFSEDGQYMIVWGEEGRVIDLKNMEIVAELKQDTEVTHVGISKDAKVVVTLDTGKKIRYWHVGEHEVKMITDLDLCIQPHFKSGEYGEVESLRLLSDGSLLVIQGKYWIVAQSIFIS
jgi:WD40 repeat protein